MSALTAEVIRMTSSVAERTVNTLRFLAVDMVEKANSGHPGMPLGAAPAAYAVWSRFMRFDPGHPEWPDRDRFVLSAGHGCALLYALLHLAGYDLPMDELKRFRQLGSRTPGHPEYGVTPGVEATTGPLGQGFANAVGMALAEASLAAAFNVAGHTIVDHHTYVLCSDGDLMEGVSSEAASLAGTLRLGKLIVLYDDNRVSIEGPTSIAFTEDTAARFVAYGWHVQRVPDGTDLGALASAIDSARAASDMPSLIAVRTHIGYGSPSKQGTAAAHGEPLGGDEVRLTKSALGWDPEAAFHVPSDVRAHMREVVARARSSRVAWSARFARYRREHPELAEEFERRQSGRLPHGWDSGIPVFPADSGAVATREASGVVLNALAARMPELMGGSADLAPSTKTAIHAARSFSADDRGGRNVHFGVREHAMGAVVNGMAYHRGHIPYSSTFLAFSDYMRPPIRIAALSGLHVVGVFTHDSVGLGEDGPTHQPIEHLAALRLIPGALVIRPADANETAAAWRVALSRSGGPVLLVLSRQKLPVLDVLRYPSLTVGVARGAYILADAPPLGVRPPEAGAPSPDVVVVATGSEVALALEARERLAEEGTHARVVSAPCLELFAEQDEGYRTSVLPADVPVVSVEAGVTTGWRAYLDSGATRALGIDRFGLSAPGKVGLSALGISTERLVELVRDTLT